MIVDMHTHFTPTALLKAARRGKKWFGWQILKDLDGREYLAFGQKAVRFPQGSSIEDPLERIRVRKAQQGIDFEVLTIIGYMWNYGLKVSDAVAFCGEVNAELADLEKRYPRHYMGLALLPMQDTRAALQVLGHATQELGLGAIAIASSVNGRNLDDPAILPVLEAAAEADVCIIVHPPFWGKVGEERLVRHEFGGSFGAPLESSLGLMSVIYSGLADRHPDLRMFFTHGGGWAQFGIGRLKLRYDGRETGRPMAAPPASYLSRFYYDCLVHDSDSLDLVVRRVGVDRITIGTDYPFDGDHPGGAVRWIQAHASLNQDDKAKILGENAARLLRLIAGSRETFA